VTFIIGTPYARNAGYFMNDDTASGGQRVEADIRTCTHCQAIIKMQEWKRIEDGKMAGGWCSRCMAPICGPCATKALTHGCTPFVELLEKSLAMDSKLAAYRKLAGLEPPEPPRALITGV
jgi:hypothetical protein